LKQFAQKTLPTLEEHQKMALQLELWREVGDGVTG
jgi:hypothetical protein